MDSFESLNNEGSYDKLLRKAEEEISHESHYWKIQALFRLGELEEALTFTQSIIDNLDEDIWRGKIYTQLGKIYGGMGEIDQSLNYHQLGLDLKKKYGQPVDLINSLVNIGNIQRAQGDLDTALATYQECIDIHEKHSVEQDIEIGFALNNIGVIFHDKGELNRALQYYQQSLDILEKTGNAQYIAVSLHGIADVYYQQGKLNEAINYHQRSLSLKEKIGNPTSLIHSLKDLIIVSLENQDRPQVESYLNYLNQLSIKTENKVVDLYYQFCKALFLKSSKRGKDKVDAQRILEKLVEVNDYRFDILVSTLNHLIELLVYEYSTYGEEVVFDEITKYTSQMYEIAQSQEMYPTIIDTLVLRAKLGIASNEFDEALNYLDRAIKTAKDHGLSSHRVRAEREKSRLMSNIKEMKELVQHSSVSEMLDNMELVDYIKLIQKLKN